MLFRSCHQPRRMRIFFQHIVEVVHPFLALVVLVVWLFLIGTILTFAGFLLSYGCPINKKVWSPTFVIITCGLASSFLALLIWIIDMKGYQNWCAFFRSFGVNPLFIYVFAETMGIALGATGVSAFIYEKMLAPALGDYPSSLVYALIYIIFCWSIVHILYKKGIYIKI